MISSSTQRHPSTQASAHRKCFSIFWLALLCLLSPRYAAAQQCEKFGDAALVGQLPPEVDESSGVIASRKNPGVWWTHNDSGGAAAIFAIDLKGKLLARFDVTGATNRDWEDIAAAPCPNGDPCLYIGDIGDNNARYTNIKIYRIPEPTVTTTGSTQTGQTAQAEVFTLTYPNGARNAEAFFVHPTTHDIIIVTKAFADRCEVYMLPGNTPPGTAVLTRVGDLDNLGDLVTGGDISPDGKFVALRFYTKAALYQVDGTGIPSDSNRVQILTMPSTKQGESIAFSTDGRSLVSTSEGTGAEATIRQQMCTSPASEPVQESTPEPQNEPSAEQSQEATPEATSEPTTTPDASTNTEKSVQNETVAESSQETQVKTGCSGCNSQDTTPTIFLFLLCLVMLLLRRPQRNTAHAQNRTL